LSNSIVVLFSHTIRGLVDVGDCMACILEWFDENMRTRTVEEGGDAVRRGNRLILPCDSLNRALLLI
jgi:hypothetical protein